MAADDPPSPMRAIDLIEPGALFRGALFADLVQSALDLQPGQGVLDVACGSAG